ncbi:pyridoxal-phosphate dependent enzyme [Sphingomonas sp.]|uniref:pyridoxal-phosphate dependent enzyme n=1 Tax=Sphingomonas sp. TaxID=28214 RepID=UPI001B26089C|nr:pyridoxal-phosphate dependent enzyme [Sphingomonas sp.]MBO9714546.1 pyridoxal-phosphate dependent enzyme [Sphingomonas sp.]
MLHVNTPLLEADRSYARAGVPLLLKMDALQPSGSFKLRGVGHACAKAREAGAASIVCPSGGNAGFSAAYAARKLGLPAIIVVPETTSAEVRDTIALVGAEVIVAGSAFDEAHEHARALADAAGAALIHPFDDPLLWTGHATLIDEIVAAGERFDVVVASVGGGGLLAGIVEGLRRNGLGDVPVIAVETEGAASLHRSIAEKRLVTLPAITSIATSLGAKRVAPHALALVDEHPIVSVTVSDAEAVAACLKFADRFRVLVEPACGAALAVADVHAGLLGAYRRPLIEVCGGVGASIGKLTAWRDALSP